MADQIPDWAQPAPAAAGTPDWAASSPPPLTPDQLQPLFQKYGTADGVDPRLLQAISMQESAQQGWRVGPQTPVGRAQGLMQIMPGNFKQYGVTNPYDEDQSIRAGAAILKDYLAANNG